jgi:hypothetical protein
MAFLVLALAGIGALAACDDGSSGQPGSTGVSVGGAGGGGGGGGGGGAGGSGGGYDWPVDTYPIDITPSPDWKNEINFPFDPFVAWPPQSDQPSWVKFTVLMHDPTKVYYQDSTAFPFHGEFATARLDPFFGMSLAEFNQVSLFEEGQEAILGAVLFSPSPETTPEVGIQLVRKDAYDPEMARVVLDLVKKSIIAPNGVTPFYFPTYDQVESATQNSAFFEASGFPVSSVERWLDSDACYATGWALGKLTYVPPDQIDAAYASGALKAEDILLTDAVPAEVPYVSGIISLSPSTPNAHTAILATSFGIPFVFISDPASAQRAKDLAGKDIALRASLKWGSLCDVSLFDADGTIAPADKEQLLGLKKPADLGIKPKQPLGAYSASTENLGPDDIVHVGGKAANYGLLRDAIPNNSDEAVALSFDLWDAFLDQAMPGGKTLRVEINEKLGAYSYPPNIAALKADLAALRARITSDAAFSAAQKQAIEAALAGFTPTRRIRFRSSTNVEDSAVFTGAGLYDSFSGCLADDQDADNVGPSLCEADEADERGVFRAIRKVYASFYNDNAVLARLMYGIKESDVGMGVLVHYSYPDEDEMANGVATLSTANPPTDEIKLVTQLGAMSVTNPEGGAQPEVVRVFTGGGSTYTQLVSGSTLVPLGDHVMTWESDYLALASLLEKVEDRFREVHPGKTSFLLDYEYKKMKPGDLVVKQVREVALPSTTPSLTPFLLSEPRELCTFQGESGDVFANHRLKTRVSLAAKSAFLTPAVLAGTLFADASAAYVVGGSVKTLSGSPAAWPSATHAYAAEVAKDTWKDGSGPEERTYSLSAWPVPELLPPSLGPLVGLRDFTMEIQAEYATPVTLLDWQGNLNTVSSEAATLGTCPVEGEPAPGAILVQRSMSAPSGAKVETSFYWPPPPTGITAGYTAPLYKWVETRIEGLTQSPIVLKGFYSQTYRPEHHNFTESFLFEPRLEAGIDPAIVAELEAKGIRGIYIWADSDPMVAPKMWTVDPMGAFHPLN